MPINADQEPKTSLDFIVELQSVVAKHKPMRIPMGADGVAFHNTSLSVAFVQASNADAMPLVVAAYLSELTFIGHSRLLTWEEFKQKIDVRVAAETMSALASPVAISDAIISSAPAAIATPSERPILVTTEYRGVFFGYATDTSGDTIHLKRARNCIYWSADAKGFLGLAATGPTKGCKVGPEADIDLRKITCVAEVTPEAVKAWMVAPWAK